MGGTPSPIHRLQAMSETEKNVVTIDPGTRTERIERGGTIGERHKREDPAGERRGGNDVPWILVCITTQRISQVRTAPASASEALPDREIFGSKQQQTPMAGGIRACDVVRS